MNNRSPKSSEQAVSETLGYIIIFGIITACIAMVFVIGSQIITQTQDRANFQSMEQNFEVISSDVSRTAFEASPAMSTRVKIDSGTLSMLPPRTAAAYFISTTTAASNRSRTGWAHCISSPTSTGRACAWKTAPS